MHDKGTQILVAEEEVLDFVHVVALVGISRASGFVLRAPRDAVLVGNHEFGPEELDILGAADDVEAAEAFDGHAGAHIASLEEALRGIGLPPGVIVSMKTQGSGLPQYLQA